MCILPTTHGKLTTPDDVTTTAHGKHIAAPDDATRQSSEFDAPPGFEAPPPGFMCGQNSPRRPKGKPAPLLCALKKRDEEMALNLIQSVLLKVPQILGLSAEEVRAVAQVLQSADLPALSKRSKPDKRIDKLML